MPPRAITYSILTFVLLIFGIRCDNPASPTIAQPIGIWQSTNGPHGGTIVSTFIDARGQLFSSTLGTGTFRSDNDGASWHKLSMNRATSISAFAEHPAKGIFAIAYSGEAFASQDNGRTWTQTASTPGADSYCLAFSSTGDLYAGGSAGLYVSSDAGNNWSKVAPTVISHAWKLIVDSQDRMFVAMPCPGLLRSTDHGQSWSLINNGIADPCVHTLELTSSGILYTSTGSTLYRSSDLGDHWLPVTGTRGYVISVTQTNSETFLVGTDQGLWRSTNDGVTWTMINGPVDHLLFRGNRIIGASAGYYQSDAVFFSDDNAFSWSRIGLPVSDVISVVTDPAGSVYAATRMSGLFSFQPATLQWAYLGLGPAVYSAAISRSGTVLAALHTGTIAQYQPNGVWSYEGIPGSAFLTITALLDSRSGILLAGTAGSGLYARSQPSGSWNRIGQDIRGDFIYSIQEDDQGYIYAVTNLGLWGSSIPLSSWRQLSDFYTQLNALLISTDGSLFLGTKEKGILYSRGPGKPWVSINNGISELDVSAIVQTRSGAIYVATSANLYESTNNGARWTTVGSGLNGHTVTSLIVLPDGRLLAGTPDEGCVIMRIR